MDEVLPNFLSVVYIHNDTSFSHGGRQRLWNANCYNSYIPLSLHLQLSVFSCMLVSHKVRNPRE
uniref:SFRICE_032012 n=1 Tax=Spodoptera frugiperda TaxID=7108 RepID=A0A2H1VR33_SPOFR